MSGAVWAAAVGSEAARLSGYLDLLARAAGFARVAGVDQVGLIDLGRSSTGWRVALAAAAEVVGEEAGVRLVVLSGVGAAPADPPLALVAVDLDDAEVVARTTAQLAAAPLELLPHVVVCLRSADTRLAVRRGPSAGAPGGAVATRRRSAAAARSVTAPAGPDELQLATRADRHLQASSTRRWPVGPSAPDAVEWACTYHVTDHPHAGVLHLPLPAARSAQRDSIRPRN